MAVSACLGFHSAEAFKGRGRLPFCNGLWLPVTLTGNGFAFTAVCLLLLFQTAERRIWLTCSDPALRQAEDLFMVGSPSAPSLLGPERNEAQGPFMTVDTGYLRFPATTCFLSPPVFRAIATFCGCYELGFVLFVSLHLCKYLFGVFNVFCWDSD